TNAGGSASATVTITVNPALPADPTVAPTALGYDAKVKVSFETPINGAATYNVYVNTDPNSTHAGDSVVSCPSSPCEVTLANGSPFYFWYKGVSLSGAVSANYSPVSAPATPKPTILITAVSPLDPKVSPNTQVDAFDPYIPVASSGHQALRLKVTAGNEDVILNYLPVKFTGGGNTPCTSTYGPSPSSEVPGCNLKSKLKPADVINNYVLSINGSEVGRGPMVEAICGGVRSVSSSCSQNRQGYVFNLLLNPANPARIIARNTSVNIDLSFDIKSGVVLDDNKQSTLTPDYYGLYDAGFSTLHDNANVGYSGGAILNVPMASTETNPTFLYRKYFSGTFPSSPVACPANSNANFTPNCDSKTRSKLQLVPSVVDQLGQVNDINAATVSGSVNDSINTFLGITGTNGLHTIGDSYWSQDRTLSAPITVDRYITNYLPNSNSGNYGNFSVVFPDIPFNLAVGSDLYPDIGFEAISANDTAVAVPLSRIPTGKEILYDKVFALLVATTTVSGDPTSFTNLLSKPVTISWKINNPVVNGWGSAQIYQYVGSGWVAISGIESGSSDLNNNSITMTGTSANTNLGLFAIMGNRMPPTVASLQIPQTLAQAKTSTALAVKKASPTLAKTPMPVKNNLAVKEKAVTPVAQKAELAVTKPATQTATVLPSIRSLLLNAMKGKSKK
ncbi:MAG: hypothetical protein AAB893_01970, partial [Patescibacteria group bacterium]